MSLILTVTHIGFRDLKGNIGIHRKGVRFRGLGVRGFGLGV